MTNYDFNDMSLIFAYSNMFVLGTISIYAFPFLFRIPPPKGKGMESYNSNSFMESVFSIELKKTMQF